MAHFLNLPAEYANLGANDNEVPTFGSKGGTTPTKRKNDENIENGTPSANQSSQPVKKPRAAAQVPVSAKSALPRYTSSRLRSAAAEKSSLTLATKQSYKSPAGNKSMIATIFNSGTKAIYDGITGIVRSPTRSAPSTAQKAAKAINGFSGATVLDELKSVPEERPAATAVGPTIRALFDAGFTIDEERVIAIIANLRCKSKWDNKEKINKQAAVITDLRAALKTTFDEAKSLKEKAADFESGLLANMQRTLSEYSVARQQVGMLGKEDLRLKQEIKELADAIKRLQTERADLLQKAFESETKNSSLVEDLAALESRRAAREHDFDRLQDELIRCRAEHQDALSSLKEEYEQRIEQLLGGYKDEVATLRSELGRSSIGKAEIARQATEQREELFSAQAQVRELRGDLERRQADVDALRAELAQAREASLAKESDMRTTLQSLQEFQRVTAEEKQQLRSEISSLQGKLVHFEDDRLSCASQLAAKIEEISSYMRENAHLKEKLAVKEDEIRAGKDSHLKLDAEKDLRVRAEIREENERRERIASTAQLLATQTECAERIRSIEERANVSTESLRNALLELEATNDNLHKELSDANDVAAGRMSEILSLKKELETASANSEAQQEVSSLKGEVEILRRKLQEKVHLQVQEGTHAAAKIRELEEQLVGAENQRRKLRNIIAELRGNVRVYARVRPFLPSDGIDTCANPESTILVNNESSSVRIRSQGDDKLFTFDKSFGPSSSQEAIFSDVSEFVQSALDGYNVCLFSYGQTGSGKTHTMTGSGTGSMRGIIPRAMQQVGSYKNELEGKGWEYFMEVSFVEIYNETIRDLLRASYSEEVKHEIKRDASGSSYISDVTLISVDPNDSDQIAAIMEKASRHRSVASTAMNEQSSRSHSVFALHLRAKNAEQGVLLKGTLSLVDLAGSERLDRSQATGSRLKETVAINKSLSSLVDVFTALANKQPHIPFRNSKLTYLLQPALSGDGKTLMMVNLSPTEESSHESLCSLRFASQVNQCELGKAKRQIQEVPIDKPPAEKSMPSTPGSAQAKKVARLR